MSPNFLIFAVDDDPLIQDILRSILGPTYAMEVFSNAEDCLRRIGAVKPDCLLLDVGLPGMDGYQLCRLLKKRDDTRHIAVTFISGYDDIEHRLQGYDAGGEDFVVKPFEPTEILRKIQLAEHFIENERRLREEARSAAELSDIAMASMSDSGILLQFTSKLIGAADERNIGTEVLDLLRKFDLEGAVQTRIADRTYTISANGENVPLEVSVLDHVRSMDRIFEFRNRAVYNFDRITVMINNMPIGDELLAGRIRDSMAIAAQTTAARLEALETEERGRRNRDGIAQALSTIERTLGQLDESHRRSRYDISQLIYEFNERLGQTFVGLALTDVQEQRIDQLVTEFLGNLGRQMDQDDGFATSLRALGEDLKGLSH